MRSFNPFSPMSMASPRSSRPVVVSVITRHLTDTTPVLAETEPISLAPLISTVPTLVSTDSNFVAGGGKTAVVSEGLLTTRNAGKKRATHCSDENKIPFSHNNSVPPGHEAAGFDRAVALVN